MMQIITFEVAFEKPDEAKLGFELDLCAFMRNINEANLLLN